MKYFMFMAFIFLAACKPEKIGEEINGFDITCLQGVQYYYRYAGVYGTNLSPVVDSETLTFVRCD